MSPLLARTTPGSPGLAQLPRQRTVPVPAGTRMRCVEGSEPAWVAYERTPEPRSGSAAAALDGFTTRTATSYPPGGLQVLAPPPRRPRRPRRKSILSVLSVLSVLSFLSVLSVRAVRPNRARGLTAGQDTRRVQPTPCRLTAASPYAAQPARSPGGAARRSRTTGSHRGRGASRRQHPRTARGGPQRARVGRSWTPERFRVRLPAQNGRYQGGNVELNTQPGDGCCR